VSKGGREGGREGGSEGETRTEMQVRKKKMGAEGRVSEARAVYSELPGHTSHACITCISSAVCAQMLLRRRLWERELCHCHTACASPSACRLWDRALCLCHTAETGERALSLSHRPRITLSLPHIAYSIYSLSLYQI
jgi:hypothetical protein